MTHKSSVMTGPDVVVGEMLMMLRSSTASGAKQRHTLYTLYPRNMSVSADIMSSCISDEEKGL